MQPWLVVETPDEVPSAADIPWPDVEIVTSGQTILKGTTSAAGMAVPLQMLTVVPIPIRHYAVEIRDTAKRKLVTAIEFLSPMTKRRDGHGRYLAKRQRRLLSPAHLLEIDLFPRRPPRADAAGFVCGVLFRVPGSGQSAADHRLLADWPGPPPSDRACAALEKRSRSATRFAGGADECL